MYSGFRGRCAAALSYFLSFTLGASQTIAVPKTIPGDASRVVDPNFPGFGFAQTSFYSYAVNESGQPNLFSQNLIKSVLGRTGGIPLLRVGGTDGDSAAFNMSQTKPFTHHNISKTETQLVMGPSYFDAFRNFPGAQYEFQVPHANRDLNTCLEWTRAGLNAIGDSLYALEIGNEPNYYKWFTQADYVNEFKTFQSALQQEFPILQNKSIFQALDMASGFAQNLTAARAFDLGLSDVASTIKQVAYHYYQGKDRANYQELKQWILHGKLVQRMKVFRTDIQWLQKSRPNIGFALTENGDTLHVNKTFGDTKFRSNLATALWGIDFQLYSMAINVTRNNMQQIAGQGFGAWDPVNSTDGPPHVKANYYAQPFVAEFIGTSRKTQVSTLSLDSNGGKYVAYAAWEGGKVARIAILNLDLWRPVAGQRPKPRFTVSGLPNGLKNATLHHLDAPNGALSQSTLTWRGLQWTYESNGLEQRVKNDSRILQIDNGVVHVDVNATSAVMLVL